jgi:ribosome-binding factor A
LVLTHKFFFEIMTNRLARVRELMKHELSEILRKDFEFGGALVTIHDIDLTPDLKQAHVYVGIVGREDLVHDALHALRKKSGPLAMKVGKRVILKNTPRLFFKIDHSVERGVRVLNIMEEVDRLTPPDQAQSVPTASVDEDDDEADDVTRPDYEDGWSDPLPDDLGRGSRS